VTVRDLFANVPARKKFLRQPGTETGYIARAVAAYAAAWPQVAIEFVADDRRGFATTGSGDPVVAATEVWGPEVGGAALRLEPLEESAAVPGVSVVGWVGAPSVTRSHRQGIVLFVNGRWVQNRALGFALEEAYHSLLMVGRHPVACASIALDPALVDVNVHPTKAEVKFADERAACRALSRAAHAALAKGPRAELPTIRFEPPAFSGERTEQRQFAAAIPERSAHPPRDDEPPPVGPDRHASGAPVLRVLGQVGAAFIIAEGPQGMYLIDQHAAHERVMYEKILAALQSREAARQPLLDPLVVDLAPEEMAAFEKSREELTAVGFEIDPFAPQAVVVRAVPALVRGVDVAERLRLILRELAEGGTGDSWLGAVAVSTACHTSIRAGQALSLAEMRELVNDLERTANPRACGHGRPTMLHMSRGELEKQFKR
jgi:DNA mismatch repair protein MutL